LVLEIVRSVLATPAMQDLRSRLEKGGVLSLPGVHPAAHPFVVFLLSQMFPGQPIVAVTEGVKAQESFHQDLETWNGLAEKSGASPIPPLFYPSWEILPHESKLPHADVIAERLHEWGLLPGTAEESLDPEGQFNRRWGYKVFDKTGKMVLHDEEKEPEQHQRNFAECVRSRKLPNADIATGHLSVIHCHLANIVARAGRNVKFDQESESIPGDAAEAKAQAAVMCDKLLANPVTEDYRIEVTE